LQTDLQRAGYDPGPIDGVYGPQTVAAVVAKGDADAAVLLRPVSVETIRAAAAADLRMPEKTTFFAPKPRTGMVFRSLD